MFLHCWFREVCRVCITSSENIMKRRDGLCFATFSVAKSTSHRDNKAELYSLSLYRPFPRARRQFGTSIALCRLLRLGLPLNRGECTVISLDEHSFLDLKVWAKKNGQLVRGTNADLSDVIYRTLYSHNEVQFY